MGKGKKVGKALLTIGGFFLGAGGAGQAFFGASSAVAGLYGAALASTLWSTFNPTKTATQDYSRFDSMMNTPSADAMIPIIYGTRKWGGNQTWHKITDDKKGLTKDIVLCEGEIDSVSDIRANDIGIVKTTEDRLMLSIKNTKNPSATIMIALELGRKKSWGTIFNYDTPQEIRITHRDLTVKQLLDKINSYDGWTATSDYPNEKASDIPGRTAIPCYNTVINLRKTVVTQEGLSGCSYEFHSGSSTQSPPSNYDVVGGYKNCAWMRNTLTVSEKLTGSNPTITSIVKGTKVLVWKNNAWVREYSENPAYCLLDFLTNKRYGLGRWIAWDMVDLDSFRESAVYCDEIVTTKVPTTLATYDAVNAKITELQALTGLSESAQTKVDNEIIRLQQSLIDIQSNPVEYTLETTPRYTLNMIIDQKQSATDHLANILSNFAGFLVYTNNRIALRIERATPVSYDFNDSNIVRESVKFNGIPSENRPNKYVIGFFDPANNWTQVKVLVEDTVDQKQRGKIVKKELTLSGCTSQSQVLRLGNLYRDISKLCPNTITFQTTTFAMHLEPGDVVTVTQAAWINNIEQIFLDKIPVRILEITKKQGIWEIKAQQYNETIYNDNLGAEINVKDYVPIASPLSSDVPDVVNLDISETFRELGNGVITSDARITWTSIDPFYKEAEVYVLSDNPTWSEIETSINDLEGTWESIGNNSGSWKLVGKATDELFMTNLVKGLTYTFKVVSVNTVNRKATFDTAPEVPIIIKSKTYTPSTPRGLQVSITNKCEWYWNALDLDCDFAELRMNDDTGNITGLLAKTSSTKATATPPSRHGVAYLYAHNTAGLYSYPCVLEYNKEAPSAPTTVTLTDVFQGVVVTTEALPLYCLGINVYVNDGTGDKVFFSANNSYTFKSTGGIFDISVAFVDIFGEGARSAVVEKVVRATIDPALIAAESLSLSMMDPVIKDAVEKAENAVDAELLNASMSSINQTTDAITQTVQTNKTNQDGVNSNLLSQVNQQAGQITQVVTDLNSANTVIAQNTAAIQLRATSANLLSLINVCPEVLTFKSSLIHISGDTLFDDDVIVSRMLSAESVTAAKVAAGAITADKLNVTLAQISGKLTAAQIDAGVITADMITTGTLSANLIYSSGYLVKAISILTGTVANGGTIPLPSGYTQSQCTWSVSINTIPSPGYAFYEMYCYANSSRVVTCYAVGREYWNGSLVASSASSGTATYTIIGVK